MSLQRGQFELTLEEEKGPHKGDDPGERGGDGGVKAAGGKVQHRMETMNHCNGQRGKERAGDEARG